jgi:hypothetical protein
MSFRLDLLINRAKSDAKITSIEVDTLIAEAKRSPVISASDKASLSKLLSKSASMFEPAAKQKLEALLNAPVVIVAPPVPPTNTDVVRSITGTNASSFSDDSIFLGRDGTVSGKAGVESYTRNYDSTKAGPLRFHHGSVAPKSTVLNEVDNKAIADATPGAALDAAAKVFGVKVDGFEKMANSKDFYNEDAEHWWGKCHAWTWSSLSNTVNKMVDVGGAEGQKGLWLGGQWMSRADLGNWMMATADTISLNDSNTMIKGDLSADELLKGTTQFLMNNGGGFVADVFNDKAKGHKEVWNQPFVGSDMTTTTLKPEVAQGILDIAKTAGAIGGVSVKQVEIKGTYGVEVGDAHEGDPGRSSKTWQMYSVCDANGKVVKSFMANDEALKNLATLPTKNTDDLPEYIWKPTMKALEDTLAGKQNYTVDSNEHGAEFKFFVGTLLAKGVPGSVRTGFETELAALPAGKIDAAKAADLAKKFANVANAYSPDQWKTLMSTRGLDAKVFGAAWPQ